MSQQHDKIAANRSGSASLPAMSPPLVCPACGMTARRPQARFCSTCGRRLADDSYLPADSLLSSYHRQRLNSSSSRSRKQSPARATHASPQRTLRFAPSPRIAATATAFAFVTYSLVPYLGILFSPGAILASAIALAHARRDANKINGGRERAASSLVLALIIFAAQLFLWWLLYKVPEWTKP